MIWRIGVLILLFLPVTTVRSQALRKSWGNTKPPYGVLLNTAHPMAQGLRIAIPFNDIVPTADGNSTPRHIRNYGSWPIGQVQVGPSEFPRGPVVSVASPVVVARKGGGTRLGFNAGWNIVHTTTGVAADFVPTSGGCTVMIGYQKRDTTRRHTTAFGVEYSSPYGMMFLLTVRSNINETNWSFGGVTEGTTRLSYTTTDADDTDDVWTCTTGVRGMELWKNGWLAASNSATPTRTAGTGFYVGAPDTPNNSDLVNVDFFYLWARQLTTTEIAYLSKFPFDVFTPPSNWASIQGAAVAGGNFTVFHGGGK